MRQEKGRREEKVERWRGGEGERRPPMPTYAVLCKSHGHFFLMAALKPKVNIKEADGLIQTYPSRGIRPLLFQLILLSRISLIKY